MKKGKLTVKQFDKMLKWSWENSLVELPKSSHYYLVKGFTTPPGSGRHTCLRWGCWCWKNLFEHPQDLLVYLRRKLTTK